MLPKPTVKSLLLGNIRPEMRCAFTVPAVPIESNSPL